MINALVTNYTYFYEDTAVFEGTTKVNIDTDTFLDVEGQAVGIRPGRKGSFSVKVDTRGWWNGVKNDVRFMLAARPVRTEVTPTKIEIETTKSKTWGGTEDVQINYFESVDIRRTSEGETVLSWKSDGSGSDDHSDVLKLSRRVKNWEWLIFVFPSSTVGSMEGEYDYNLEVAIDRRRNNQ